MFDVEKSDAVLDALGQKALDAIGRAVAATRADLGAYRRLLPRFAAEASQRGLHNWIHDWMFANALVEIDGMPGASYIDEEPVRDLCFGSTLPLIRLVPAWTSIRRGGSPPSHHWTR